MFATQSSRKTLSEADPKVQCSAVNAGKQSHESNSIWRSLSLRPQAIQTKLAVSQPGDPFEQEADRIADRVTSAPTPSLQRACDCGGACGQCGTATAEPED